MSRQVLVEQAADYRFQHEVVLNLAQESLRISQAIQDKSGRAGALMNLGSYLRVLGRHQEALAHLEAARSLAGEISDLPSVAECHYGLAAIYQRRRQSGDLNLAIRHAQEAIVIAQRIGLSHIEVLGRSLLAMAYLIQNNVDQALAASTRAVDQLDELGSVEGTEEEVYFNHFQVLQAAGHSDAMEALQRARTLVRQKADRISDPALQRSFLEQVPLNRRILENAVDQG